MTETADVKQARIVETRPRSVEVALDWPIEFDGQTWDKITVRRVTGVEVEQFLDSLKASEGGLRNPPPMIACPPEVYYALDDDDRLRLEEAMYPFLPQRWKRMTEEILAGRLSEARETSGKS